MNALLYFEILCVLLLIGMNCLFGLIAYSMAKLRNLRPVPVFAAAIFGSIAVVFFVGMFPKTKQKDQFPKDIV